MTWRLFVAQDFSEKPKGDALEKMKVDTTLLGGGPPRTHRELWKFSWVVFSNRYFFWLCIIRHMLI